MFSAKKLPVKPKCVTHDFSLYKKTVSKIWAIFSQHFYSCCKTLTKQKINEKHWQTADLWICEKNSKITKYDLKTAIIFADNCENMAEASNPPLNQNDNQSTIAFRNLKNAKLFALDIGGSLTKIAYYSTRISQRLLHRPDSKIR